jgi:hypothetical protein
MGAQLYVKRIPADIIAVAMPGAAGRDAFLVLALP